MWDRTILKANAQTALHGKYWTAYAACLICVAANGFSNLLESFFTRRFDWLKDTDYFRYLESQPNLNGLNSLSVLLGIMVGLPIVVGVARFFVQNHFGVTDIRTVFSGFQRNYGNTLGAMFVTYLFIGLWTLLLIIPGIVKGLEYSMVPFILSDNPSMPGSRARQISSMMTNGEKGSIFVLGLSFLGWYILAGIVSSIVKYLFWPISGIVSVAIATLVTAYATATFAELYIFLRDRAIQSGMVQPAEFGLVPPPAGNVPPVM